LFHIQNPANLSMSFLWLTGASSFDLAIAARRKIEVKQRYFDRAEKRALSPEYITS
jgi:hypothetical protein